MTVYKILCENKFDGVILVVAHKQIEYIYLHYRMEIM